MLIFFHYFFQISTQYFSEFLILLLPITFWGPKNAILHDCCQKLVKIATKILKNVKTSKTKKRVLFVSQMSSYSEKMRENEAVGEELYILEGHFRSLIWGNFLCKSRTFAKKYPTLNFHQKSTVENWEMCEPILEPN